MTTGLPTATSATHRSPSSSERAAPEHDDSRVTASDPEATTPDPRANTPDPGISALDHSDSRATAPAPLTSAPPLHLHLLNNDELKPVTTLPSGKSLSHDDVFNVDYSRAIEQLGLGRFHLILALSCGFMFMAAGLQNNLNAYILSSVHCDLHITSSQMGLLNAVFLVGGITSNFLWGVVADMLGRKTVVVYGMLFDGLLTLISSLSQNYPTLLIFRFLNGFIIGGPSALVLAYMGEFFPDRSRATAICYVGIFWTLSWIFMPALAWLVIPFQWSFVSGDFVFNSWRLLIALNALPSLFSAALLWQFPESPRFLLVKGDSQQALTILSHIFSLNTLQDPAKYPVKSLRPHLQVDDVAKDQDPKSFCRPITVLVNQARLLLSPGTVGTTALTSFLFFSNMFGYYGLGLWLPELFNRMASHLELSPEAQVTMCTAGVGLSANSSAIDSPCDPTDVDTSVFIKSVLMGIFGLFGNVLSGVLASRLQRRTLPVILMGLSSLCIVVIHYTSSMTFNVVLASVFQLTIGTANLVYNSLIVDMFPARVSGMGVCVAILSGRLGGMISNLVFGHLLDINCSIPIFLVAAVLLGGSIASFVIPKEPYSERPSSSSSEKINQEIFVIA